MKVNKKPGHTRPDHDVYHAIMRAVDESIRDGDTIESIELNQAEAVQFVNYVRSAGIANMTVTDLMDPENTVTSYGGVKIIVV